MLLSYLTNRRQRVKIGIKQSEWIHILKGVPQGSILVPILFNLFISDLMLQISHMDTVKIYNYADDNTLSCSGPVVDDAIADLEAATESALRWFDINGLQANPDKFQVMILNGTPSGTYTVIHC